MHKHTHTQHTYLHIFKPNEVMRIPSSGPYLCPLLHRGTEKCRQHKCSRSIEQAYTSSTTLPSHWSAGAVQCSILFFFAHFSPSHFSHTRPTMSTRDEAHKYIIISFVIPFNGWWTIFHLSTLWWFFFALLHSHIIFGSSIQRWIILALVLCLLNANSGQFVAVAVISIGIRFGISTLGGLGFHIRCYCWCFWEIDSVSFTWRIWRRILVPLECVFGALAHTQIRDWMEFMIEEGSIIRHMNLWLSMYVEFSRIFFFHSYFAACARFSSLLCEWNIVWFDVADHIPFDAVFIDKFFWLVWFIRPWMSVFGATEMRSTIGIDGMRKALHEKMIFLENIALSNIFGDWWRWDGFLWDDRKLWCSD